MILYPILDLNLEAVTFPKNKKRQTNSSSFHLMQATYNVQIATY